MVCMRCTLGMSWEAALEKNETLTDTDEGFWVSHQVNNNHMTSPPPPPVHVEGATKIQTAMTGSTFK